MGQENTTGWNVIVGAGLTGLTTAQIPAGQGEKCMLLEKEPVIGGLCRSRIQDGITFDAGPHILFNGPDLPNCQSLEFFPLQNVRMLRRRYRFALNTKGRIWKFAVVPSLRG